MVFNENAGTIGILLLQMLLFLLLSAFGSDHSVTFIGLLPENRVVRPTVLPTVGRRAPKTLYFVGSPLGPYGLR